MSGELAAAGLNSHTMHMADLGEGVQSARYECVLKGPNGEDIFLTGGPQTVGRGHGGAQSKRISHKQISVVANTHNGMARVQGLPTKNISGVALGGGPWQPLGPEANVDLKNGDMIALLMDEGADEAETTTSGGILLSSAETNTGPGSSITGKVASIGAEVKGVKAGDKVLVNGFSGSDVEFGDGSKGKFITMEDVIAVIS